MAQLTPLLLLALVAARGAGAQTYSALLPGFACTRQDAACAALGDLYAATNGAQWTTNTGWAAAAGGVAQDYCTALYKVACNVAGRLTRMCVHRPRMRKPLCCSPARLLRPTRRTQRPGGQSPEGHAA
jgi:hypothetical protein